MAAACGPGQGAVRISISYAGPRDACLVVRTSPVSKPTQVEERRLEKLKHLATKTIGVVPAPGAGDELAVTVTVHERGCDGPLLFTQTRSATATRAVTLLELGILVRDADDDGYADARGTFSGGQQPGTDCDDTREGIHPGAPELCNGLDDDCNDVRDDGQQANTYFPDMDGDGWGVDVGDAGQRACVQPPGFAADAGDCDDYRGFVHPGGIDTCNGFDDDCDQEVDEGYDVGKACTTGATCTGVVVCTDAGTTFCTAPFPRAWYPDGDGDGHGAPDGGEVFACVLPEGRSANADDCDDGNRFIHTGAREVCDGKDDDCDPSTAEVCSDAGVKGFKRFPLPTNGAAFRAIAPFARGFTWVVGEGSQIVLRVHEPGFGTPPTVPDAGDGGADAGPSDAGVPATGYDAGVGDGGFFNYSGKCTGNFRAAWAAPSGRLYLGEANNIDRLELDGGCTESWFTIQPASDVSGMSGVVTPDGGVTVFAAVHDRRLVRIADLGDAGAVSDKVWQFDAGLRLYTVSALGRDQAVVAGDFNNAQLPFFAQIDPDGGIAVRILPAFGAPQPFVLASGMVGAQRSYFAGYNLMAYESTVREPALVSGPTAGTHFVGLAAFGDRHVLILDWNGKVWRWYGVPQGDGGLAPAELWVDLAPATGGALMRAMKATAPDDVWVAGDSNNVLHFGD